MQEQVVSIILYGSVARGTNTENSDVDVALLIKGELNSATEDSELHRLLGALLSKSITQTEKLNIIGNEYDIPLEDEFRKELGSMCNLSQGIVEDTERETTEKIIMNMCESNFTVEQIALATRKTVEEVQAIIENNQAVLV
jgi:predicted nucleotidyltransferase